VTKNKKKIIKDRNGNTKNATTTQRRGKGERGVDGRLLSVRKKGVINDVIVTSCTTTWGKWKSKPGDRTIKKRTESTAKDPM